MTKEYYTELSKLKEKLLNIKKKGIEGVITNLSDLKIIIESIEKKERIDGEKWAMVGRNICPKCGSKIKQTQTNFGGNEDDPEPDGIYYRVGCEKCDFYLEEDTIYT